MTVTMKKLYTIFILLYSLSSFAKEELPPPVITGPTSVMVGQTTNYSYPNATVYPNYTWNVVTSSMGAPDVVWKSGSTYYVDINWYGAGSATIQFLSSPGGTVIATLAVTVTACTPPATPSVTFSAYSSTCAPRTISYTGTPPSGVTWYWQTSSSGTSFSSSTVSYSAASSGTYYLRAWNGACWGTNSASYSVTMETPPATPTVPTATTNACGPKTLSRGTPPGGVGWYWQTTPTGEDYTSAIATATTYTASTNGTYSVYLRPRTTGGCWGAAAAKSVTVDFPVAPPSSTAQYCESMSSMPLWGDDGLLPPKWYDTNNNYLYTGYTYTPTNLYVGNYTYYVANVSAAGCESSKSTVNLTVTSGSSCDDNLNWSENTSYTFDDAGNSIPIQASKVYADGHDAVVQSQAKSFATNQVFATQNIYDTEGNQTLSTLAAPINSSLFGYLDKFVSRAGGAKYDANDFDLRTQSGAPGEITNPKPVANNGIGSLGWYYSSANTLEPNTPTTSFPYARAYSITGPNPTSAKSAGPGDAYRMGASHEALGEKFKFTRSELQHYYTIWPSLTPSPVPITEGNNLMLDGDVSSAANFTANLNASISYLGGGNPYVRVTANQSTGNPGVWIDAAKTVTPGTTYKFRINGSVDSSPASTAKLYVKNISANSDLAWSTTVLPTNFDFVEVLFTIPAGCTSIRVGVMWTTPAINAQMNITEVSLTNMYDGAAVLGYKYISTDPDGKKTASFVDMDGRSLASAMVASVTGTGTNQVFTYNNWSYAYYNEMGQVLATVAPNGVNTASTAIPSFVTTYKYDHLGRVIETTSTDEGTSKFTYSDDGKIRFSQDQAQRNATPPRFSYTNYDYLGRLIEAGEYTMSGSGYYVFETHSAVTQASNSVLGIVNSEGYTGVTRRGNNATAIRYSDTTFVDYDFPSTDYTTDTDHPVQTELMGQISKTKNGNAITWYSYDELGQLKWTKQAIFGLGTKTVDYTYDNSGNVTTVVYQKNQADGFYHHYLYDLDQRLKEVWTNKQGADPALQAKYSYYLHGPLKRIELAGNKQGIDYVYTISGGLKGINHADGAKDPGLDGISGPNAGFEKDIFGMNLHYYDNDYAGASYSAGSLTVGGSYPNQYGGNIKAMSYTSPAQPNNNHVYGFQYDALNQMSNAQWGLVTGSAGNYGASFTEAYREQIPGYDKNGNIQSLVRKGKDAQTLANYTYVYEANTNKLDRVDHNNGTTTTTLTDYTYNAIGQMITQTEGSNVMNIKYNAYGLVKEIRNGSNQLILEYRYDDRGDLVNKVYYTNGVAAKSVFYVSDAGGSSMAIYEQLLPGGSAQLIEVPIYGSTRIATYKPLANTYFYEVNDHLGNVRGVIGVSDTETFSANLESGLSGSGQGVFDNYTSTSYDLVDHTDAAGTVYQRSQSLNGGASGRVGLSKSLAVRPGDQLNISAYVKYMNLTTTGNATPFITSLAAAFGVSSSSTGEQLKIYNGLNNYAGTVPAGDHVGDDESAPKAFVTILLFDKNYNLLDATWDQVGTTGAQTNSNVKQPPHDLLTTSYVVEEAGYAFMFLSNEHPYYVDVYFDDVVVTHEHSPVVAGADFYPYGLVMEGREITDEFYRYGYQGQYSEENAVTGWNEFELRMYDARFGRWLSVDPADQYASPYVSMGNNPTIAIDTDGQWSFVGSVIGTAFGVGLSFALGEEDHWYMYAAGGFIAGGILGEVMHSSHDQSSHAANAWDKFTAKFGEGVVSGAGSSSYVRYIPTDINSIGSINNRFAASFDELYAKPLKELAKHAASTYELWLDFLNKNNRRLPTLRDSQGRRLIPSSVEGFDWNDALSRRENSISHDLPDKIEGEQEYGNPGYKKLFKNRARPKPVFVELKGGNFSRLNPDKTGLIVVKFQKIH